MYTLHTPTHTHTHTSTSSYSYISPLWQRHQIKFNEQMPQQPLGQKEKVHSAMRLNQINVHCKYTVQREERAGFKTEECWKTTAGQLSILSSLTLSRVSQIIRINCCNCDKLWRWHAHAHIYAHWVAAIKASRNIYCNIPDFVGSL